MADKSVGELIAAQSVTPTDLFVLEQNGTAKKLTGQILENWLVSFADGHGGIQSIAKLGTSSLADTYRITLADTTTFDFVVTNGRGVSSLRKTGTSGLVDTYTFTYNDGTKETFTVTNGEKGDKGNNAYIWIKYASQEPTESSHSIGDIPDDWIGIYSGNASTAPTDWQQYKWFKHKGEQGDAGNPATLASKSVTYQVSDSGTIIPSGSWGSSIPVVSQGKYLWTKTEVRFNTGDPIVSYSVARMGIDGSGSVSSVSGVSPDSDGNVTLTSADVGALPTSGGDMTGEIRMNGQPISGLNEPAEGTQAANKGYVDTAKAEANAYTDTAVRKAAPRNLLDNSDFRNPVNQRGNTSYIGGYGIDRWKQWNSSSTIYVHDGYITVSIIQQHIGVPIDFDTVYTFAAKKTDGTILCLTGTFNTKENIGGLRLDYDTNTDGTKKPYVSINAGGDYLWAALYEGEYTAETLPEYQPKGYGAELAECMRYYQSIAYPRQIITRATGGFEALLITHAQMRAVPTATLISRPDWIRMANTHINVSDVEISSVAGGTVNTQLMVKFTTSADITSNSVGYLDTMRLTLSADL